MRSKIEGDRRIISYRLYPTAIQQKKLNGYLGACRKTYNELLEFYYSYSRKPTNEDMQYFRYELMERCPWYYEYDIDTVYDQIVQQIRGSLNSLRSLKKNGRKTGKLKFKGSGEFTSFYCRHAKLDTMMGALYLPKLGWIYTKVDSAPKGKVVIVRIIKELDKWYAKVCYALNRRVVFAGDDSNKKDAGIDVGLDYFYYDSDGNSVKRPKFLKPNTRKIRLISRKMSRRMGPYDQKTKTYRKPSKNWLKAQKWYQIVHARIRRRRENFLHNESTKLARRYDRIFVEKLNIKNMTKNRHLSSAIMDAGWYKFKQLLSYKTEVIEVNPRFTSQECSHCYCKMKISLSVRTYVCPNCGHVLPRDHNSAINILARGRSDLALKKKSKSTDAQSGTVAVAATPAEIGVRMYPSRIDSSRSGKQESLVKKQKQVSIYKENT